MVRRPSRRRPSPGYTLIELLVAVAIIGILAAIAPPNPGTMRVLRESGYANIGDSDPRGAVWVYSAAFADCGTPANQGEMGACSKGPAVTGHFTFPPTSPKTKRHGSVGYSSLYGAFQEEA